MVEEYESEGTEVKKNIEWAIKEIEGLETEPSQNYPHDETVEKEIVLDILSQLNEPEVLSQEWIDEHKVYCLHSMQNGYFISEELLQNLLVPKQEITYEDALKVIAENLDTDKFSVGLYIEALHNNEKYNFLTGEWIERYTSPVDDEGRLYVWKSDLQNTIVPKQELPVIPKFVAEFLEGKEDYMLYELFDNDFIYDNHDELARWLYNNDDDTNRGRELSLVLAQKYGYTVEKEQQYYALIKDHELLKDKGDWVVPTYWCFDTTNGNMFISDRITVLDKYLIKASKSEWNNLGINEHNADFVSVEELEE